MYPVGVHVSAPQDAKKVFVSLGCINWNTYFLGKYRDGQTLTYVQKTQGHFVKSVSRPVSGIE